MDEPSPELLRQLIAEGRLSERKVRIAAGLGSQHAEALGLPAIEYESELGYRGGMGKALAELSDETVMDLVLECCLRVERAGARLFCWRALLQHAADYSKGHAWRPWRLIVLLSFANSMSWRTEVLTDALAMLRNWRSADGLSAEDATKQLQALDYRLDFPEFIEDRDPVRYRAMEFIAGLCDSFFALEDLLEGRGAASAAGSAFGALSRAAPDYRLERQWQRQRVAALLLAGPS